MRLVIFVALLLLSPIVGYVVAAMTIPAVGIITGILVGFVAVVGTLLSLLNS